MVKEILLINDNEDEFEIFKEALYSIDNTAQFRQVKNAAEALKFLRLRLPEYIFIDFNKHDIKDLTYYSSKNRFI
jgi:CheY-like chemotaxis protein